MTSASDELSHLLKKCLTEQFNQKKNKETFKKLKLIYSKSDSNENTCTEFIRNLCIITEDGWCNVESTSRRMSMLTALLTDCPFMKSVFHNNLENILNLNSQYLETKCSHKFVKNNHLAGEEYSNAYKCTKFTLQIISIFRENLKTVISEKNKNISTSLSRIFSACLVALSNKQIIDVPYQQMCGVVIGHILNFSSNQASGVNLLQVISKKHSKDSIKVCDGIQSKITQSRSMMHFDANYSIWVLRGILSSTNPRMFIKNSQGEDGFLFLSFYEILNLTSVVGNDHYHAFQALQMWWNHVLTLLKTGAGFRQSSSSFFTIGGTFNQTCKDLVWKHWDNPVPGVVQLVLSMFKTMLDVHVLIRPNQKQYFTDLMDELIALPIFVQGKYGPMALLIPKIGALVVVKSYENILENLVECLAVNHLASVVSKFYKSVVVNLTAEKAFNESLWVQLLSRSLIDSLCNCNKLIQNNALRFWLPVNLSSYPKSFELLQEELTYHQSTEEDEVYQRRMQAYATSIYLARKTHHVPADKINIEICKLCLGSFQDETRAKAFGMICCTSKVVERVTQQEIALIKQYLPLSMDSASPTFRHTLSNSLHAFLTRIRDSVLYSIKSKDVNDYAEMSLKFVKWFNDLCLTSLHISSSYQRKTTALDLYIIMLKTFVATPQNNNRKKGLIPSTINIIHEKMKNEMNFEILTEESKQILLELFHDIVPEIRENAFNILMVYFLTENDVVNINLKEAFILLKSPKAQLSEGAALSIRYKHHGFLHAEEKWECFTSQGNTTNNDCATRPSTNLLTSLKDNLTGSINDIKSRTCLTCYLNPPNGWLLALSSCFQNYVHQPHHGDDLINLMQEVVNISEHLTSYSIGTVFGTNQNLIDVSDAELSSSDLNVSADFEQITSRVNRLILDDAKANNFEQVLLSTDHEVVLACFWLNLKRCGTLLCSIAQCLLQSKEPTEEVVSFLRKIYNLLVNILTNCRHRGVIESCFDSFQTVTQLLLSSKSVECSAIPKEILQTIMMALKTESNAQKIGATITRQSAGIPLIIEGILVSEVHKSDSAMIQSTINDLLSICESPTDQVKLANEFNDLPQVHALFVVKQLFKNTKLGSTILKFGSQAFKVCLSCMSSPIWVVRNGATYLFGNLVARMLGQKHVETDQNSEFQNSITTDEFFSFYPELYEVILNVVKSSVKDENEQRDEKSTNGYDLQHGLHATLAMLSKLTYGCGGNQKYDTEVLANHLLVLLGCPILPVRRLTCKVILSIVSSDCSLKYCNMLIDRIPTNGDYKTKTQNTHQNLSNGILMFLNMGLLHGNYNQDDTRFIGFMKKLNVISWLGQPCERNNPLNASLYLEILVQLRVKYNQYCLFNFSTFLHQTVLNTTEIPWINEISGKVYLDNLIKLVLCSSEDDASIQTAIACLQHKSYQIQNAALLWIKDHCNGLQTEGLSMMWRNFKELSDNRETNSILFDTVLKLHHVCKLNSLQSHVMRNKINKCVDKYLKAEVCLSLKCKSMQIAAILLQQELSEQIQSGDAFSSDSIQFLVDIIYQNTSYQKVSEPERLAAGLSLQITGRTMLRCLKSMNEQDSETKVLEMVGKLCLAAISLMYDEQVKVQQHACKFVATLRDDQQKDVQYHNVSSRTLLKYIVENFPSTLSTIPDLLLEKLYTPESIQEDRKVHLFKQEAFNMYEEPLRIACNLIPFILGLMTACNISLEKHIKDLNLFAQTLQEGDGPYANFKSLNEHSDIINVSKFLLTSKLILLYCEQRGIETDKGLYYNYMATRKAMDHVPKCFCESDYETNSR